MFSKDHSKFNDVFQWIKKLCLFRWISHFLHYSIESAGRIIESATLKNTLHSAHISFITNWFYHKQYIIFIISYNLQLIFYFLPLPLPLFLPLPLPSCFPLLQHIPKFWDGNVLSLTSLKKVILAFLLRFGNFKSDIFVQIFYYFRSVPDIYVTS